ncbi:metallophosphoesterase [Acidithiobacillus ferrooxidans]|uniref:Ser/Thr protein phosphatase family protein n=1 Tax=Acidithiobacillus ferrooxidans (strain ATCC 23270 / DSM 14882 / CIP 104768 / NCIMB 8455) TaxID=243159 RepID=B7J863_ACIF2|nr:metallophosphoesterase [Acidithiobacillus ferrooxidans]ACK78677.1 Ser/Thr protein phosphatase family protein [Acidithiobacillus ferrooxidans ATCC 23270]
MFLTSQPTVIHHAVNAQGRDFIVGDLHGCRSMLDALLGHAGFDTARDRLFSVGDLVDRGPDSMACLDLLLEPWFYPVLGNHDAMLMAWILKDDQDLRADVYGGGFALNGGLQWAGSLGSWANEFLPLLQAMPLVRVIGQDVGANDRFHVAHAELRMPDGRGFSNGNLDEEGALAWDLDHFIPGFGDNGDWRDHVLWGRSLIHDFLGRSQRGSEMPEKRNGALSTTYVGHTIVPPTFGPGQNTPLRVQSHVFLDGGAFNAPQNARYGLVIWCHGEDRGWLLNNRGEVVDLDGDAK